MRTPFSVLCRCLTGALGQPLSEVDLPCNAGEWEKVLKLSGQHLVTPSVRWALREQGRFSELPADVADYLDAVHELNLLRNRECEQQLHDVIALLGGIGVQPVLLKGAAAIAGGLYPTSGERMISDLDILVSSDRLADAVDVLAEAGYQTSAGHSELAESGGWEAVCHHYPPLYRADLPAVLELHVQPVDLPFVKLLSSADVFGRAVTASWAGGECLLPSPTDFVAHNTIHALLVNTQGKLEQVSVRQLFEFALAIRTYGDKIDWCALGSRFSANGGGRALRQYLALASACLDLEPVADARTDFWDRSRVKAYLSRIDLDSPTLEWTINLLYQTKSRARNLWRKPDLGRKLLDPEFYARWVRSIKRVD